jgi:transcriptional regulator with XRE-family HTH domain
MNFAKALRMLRAILNYDQGEVCQKAGLCRGYLSLLETGRREPSDATLEALAGAVGVEVKLIRVLAWERTEYDDPTIALQEKLAAGLQLLALVSGGAVANPADHVVHLPNGREVSDEVLDLAARAAFEALQVTGLAFAPEVETHERQDHHVWDTAPKSDVTDAQQIAWDVLVDRKSNEESFQRWLKAPPSRPNDGDSPELIERYRTAQYLACDAARDVGETMLRLSERAVIETRERVNTPAPSLDNAAPTV